MYDLNQTMQALGTLAIVHATFEEAGANLEIEKYGGDKRHCLHTTEQLSGSS